MSKALQIAVFNYEQHMRDRDYPECFPSEEEYNGWAAIENITVHTQPIRRFACRDCTTQYQLNMKREGKCINPQLRLERFAD